MLVQNVKFLAAGELDLVGASVRRLLAFEAASVRCSDPRDLSLGERARVVLVQNGGLAVVQNAVVRVEFLHLL